MYLQDPADPARRRPMMKHVFDARDTATHEDVAARLHALADEIGDGAVRLTYDEWDAPTAVVDPVGVVIDVRRNRHHAELTLRMRWNTHADEGSAAGA
jgi:amphi-Trp domain-containing protein